ncbi:MarR family winged helix-turn-helix transcriptional regulator [Nocardia alni]|uniref:MarR family winged helix-turn-helix transcriptional regulator n=1 Tax=Nocardia alni TaxID=2815723 RepID=UPI0027E09F07|nr:MarR family transcriptional regulator [Nocardia alni]
MPQLTPRDYATLLNFRTALRRFERWSEERARQVGLTATQHQLLLAVTGHQHDQGPTIGDIADYLTVRHHSAVGLIDRAVTAGLVARVRDEQDSRIVRLVATALGAQRIESLSELHLTELGRLAPVLDHLTARLPVADGAVGDD